MNVLPTEKERDEEVLFFVHCHERFLPLLSLCMFSVVSRSFTSSVILILPQLLLYSFYWWSLYYCVCLWVIHSSTFFLSVRHSQFFFFLRDECLSTSSEQGLVSQSLLSFVRSLFNEWVMNHESRGKRRKCKPHLPLTLFFFHRQSMHMIKGRQTDSWWWISTHVRRKDAIFFSLPLFLEETKPLFLPLCLYLFLSPSPLKTIHEKKESLERLAKNRCLLFLSASFFSFNILCLSIEKKTKWWEEKQRESKKEKSVQEAGCAVNCLVLHSDVQPEV